MTHRAHKWQSTSLRDGPCTRSLYPGRLEGLRLSKLASYKLRQKATARQPSLAAPPRVCRSSRATAAAPCRATYVFRRARTAVPVEMSCLGHSAAAKADWVRRAVVSGEPLPGAVSR